MAKAIITKEIQQEASDIIDAFNQKTFKDPSEAMYIPKFKGKFLYLNRKEYDRISPVARLTYSGTTTTSATATYGSLQKL